MEVYIEIVVIDNFVIDYIILNLCMMQTKACSRWWRKSISSLIGTILAVISVYPIHGALLFALKVITSFAMVFVAFGKKNFFKNLAVFYVMTFLLGGLSLGILYLKEGLEASMGKNIFKIPTGIIVFSLFFGYLSIKKIIYILKKVKHIEQFTYQVEIFSEGEIRSFKGFLDTGNFLTWSGDMKGIMVGSYIEFLPLLKGKKTLGEIEVSTVSGGNNMSIYQFEKVKIKGDKETLVFPEMKIALSKSKISSDFSILLSPYMF